MFNILNGFRVLDLTTVVLGPFATQMLGDFGAEVIKIENLGGDMMRAVRPGKSDEMGAGFVNCNRNKDCVAINLKTEQGKEIFYRLVESADAVVHNMRNKTAVNLGIGYEDLKSIKPDIVYCGAQGFGEKGPSSDIPAYDDIIQAASGLSYLNSDEQGHPRYLPTIVADKVSGLQLTVAVLGGLINKERTGEGCFIESPMFEGLVAFLMAEQLAGHSYIPSTGTTGYDRLTAPYRRPYPTKDGYMAILPYSTKNWVDFFTMVGRPEWANWEIVRDPIKRSENINTLYEKLYEIAPEKTTEEWDKLLRHANIPHTKVNRLDDLLDNKHLKEVGLFKEYEHPSEGPMRQVRSHYTMEGVEQVEDKVTQLIGQSTEKILMSVGYTSDEINSFANDNVIKCQ
ncbi:MAG: CoA transferase [Gammaproteobacteria bacterium]|mgnify:FL=1|nr:CoA transferase [Gammaproteobacteria bacterium]|tara:strand:+ start:233 stop:1426 length:1194 start_codon:yes stop_codon:yes gene_type:complete